MRCRHALGLWQNITKDCSPDTCSESGTCVLFQKNCFGKAGFVVHIPWLQLIWVTAEVDVDQTAHDADFDLQPAIIGLTQSSKNICGIPCCLDKNRASHTKASSGDVKNLIAGRCSVQASGYRFQFLPGQWIRRSPCVYYSTPANRVNLFMLQ